MNELLGEAEGDALLKLVGERLMILVDQPERLARIGDDEFAIIQPEAGGARHAEIYARRIEEALKDALAQVPQHARPAREHRDRGLARQGRRCRSSSCTTPRLPCMPPRKPGGGTFRVYQREMEKAAESHLEMERAIGEGLHQGWFEVHFQPQYDLGTRRLTGFEALARLHHPQLGDVSPDVFVPIADRSGLIHPLGEWIIHQALTTAATWPRHIMLSINISLAQFQTSDVAGTDPECFGELPASTRRGCGWRYRRRSCSKTRNAINDQLHRLRKRGVIDRARRFRARRLAG